MAARIALLILMTGVFAAAWSSDHAPIPVANVTPPSVPASPYPQDTIRETTLHRWKMPRQDREPIQIVEIRDPFVLSDTEIVIEMEVADAWQAVQTADMAATHASRIELGRLWQQIQVILTGPTAIASEPTKSVRK